MRLGEDQGFTLMEVLVAFTVAAILMLPLLRSFSTGLAAAGRGADTGDAVIVARSALAETAAADLAAAAESRRNVGRYEVTTQISRYMGGGAAQGPVSSVVPYRVEVSVAWRDGARRRSMKLTTLRLGPPPLRELQQ